MRWAIAILLGALWGVPSLSARADDAALLTYPRDGATEVNGSHRFKWTRVHGATYQLVIGTAPGAQNIFLSDVLRQKRLRVDVSLPAGVTLYARLWTFVGERAAHTDSSFTVADNAVDWIYPEPGARDVGVNRPFEWQAVPFASRYYLQIGTSPGAGDLLSRDCGAETGALVPRLPEGPVLHARVWAQVGWRVSYADVAFVSVRPTAEWLFPLDGDDDVDTSVPFEWTPVDGATYVLWIGTTPDGSEIWQTNEMDASALAVPGLPENTPLYGTLWTHLDGTWSLRSVSFVVTAGPVVTAEWTHPLDGETDVLTPGLFEWTAPEGAEGFSFSIGSTSGASDLFASESLPASARSYLVPSLPWATPLYARLWTRFDGVWRWREVVFEGALPPGQWLYPLHGAVGVDSSLPLRWSTQANVEAFRLEAGTSPGIYDLSDTAPFLADSYDLPPVPLGSTVYARLWTSVGGTWSFQDAVFTTDPAPEPSRLVYPSDGATSVDANRAFEWTAVPTALAHRLRIAPSAGGADVFDSGEISVTRQFAIDLPAGVPLTARLATLLGGEWQETTSSFTVGEGGDLEEATLDTAYWATTAIRDMALPSHLTIPGTSLADAMFLHRQVYATCGNYSAELERWLREIRLPGAAHMRATGFSSSDGHVVVEHQFSPGGPWRVLDPTFVLTPRDPVSGAPLSVDDLSSRMRAGEWDAVEYVPLEEASEKYLLQYYLDYPLLFLNPAPVGLFEAPAGEQLSPLPYLVEAALPIATTWDLFVAQCPENTEQVVLEINGAARLVPCRGPFRMSASFFAAQVESAAGAPPPRVFRPKRFVF